MRTVDFTNEHIERAMEIARECYRRERTAVSALPETGALPDLTEFAENKLGAAAFENDEMVGFLCCLPPTDNAFGTTGACGTFSPIHAHGALGENRGQIYARLYEAAAQKWAAAGIASHSVGLYAHDRQAVDIFFRYGFGLRCVDAVRLTEDSIPFTASGYEFSELSKRQAQGLWDMFRLLAEHFEKSPIFMKFNTPATRENFNTAVEVQNARYFAVSHAGKYIAYIKISPEGENFATLDPAMSNICGAYCMPEHRGAGVYQSLLSYLNETLRKEGFVRLGVDFESFNPTAWGFWQKHFTAYTYGVVRRIDGNSISLR